MSGSRYDDGGKSVEVFVPSTGQQCQLPDLPGNLQLHSMEKMTVCGGEGGKTFCLSLTDGAWKKTTSLLESRLYHSAI